MAKGRLPTEAETNQIYDIGMHQSQQLMLNLNRQIKALLPPHLAPGALILALAKIKSVIVAWEQVQARTDPEDLAMFNEIFETCRKVDGERVEQGFREGVFVFADKGE